jgi:predicted TPR repeat methyltransferase
MDAPDETPLSMNDSYDEFPRIEAAFQDLLDESLSPRGPASLWDVVGTMHLGDSIQAIDVGCGEGDDAVALHEKLGVAVVGVDPVARHVELATAAAAAAGAGARVSFQLGTAERIPVADESVDFVWCKEVLMYADLDLALAEFERVMCPGGRGFVYQVFTGDQMSDEEAAAFWGGDGLARSVRAADVERALPAAGLQVLERVDFGSEWGEYAQEKSGAGGRRLAHVARLRRDPQRYIDAFGVRNYRIMLDDCLWHVYRMIGKLHAAAFTFAKPAGMRSA